MTIHAPLVRARAFGALCVNFTCNFASGALCDRCFKLKNDVASAATILALTLVAAIHTRLQGILITVTGMAMFIVAMLLIPRVQLSHHQSTRMQPAIAPEPS